MNERGSAGGESYAGPDITKKYLNEIGAHPLLTKDDEYELWFTMDSGSVSQEVLDYAESGRISLSPEEHEGLQSDVDAADEARTKLIVSNLRLVVSIAKKYQNSGMPLLDLIQDGNTGLEHSVDLFDATKGFKFSTYSTWWIRQSIERGIANKGRIIRLPAHMEERVVRVNRAMGKLLSAGVHEPSLEQLADESGLSADVVTETQRVTWQYGETLSLDKPQGEEGSDFTLGDVIASQHYHDPEEEIGHLSDKIELSEIIQECLSKGIVSQQGIEILSLRYGLGGNGPMTLDAIKDNYGVTRERIRQIEKRTLENIRTYLGIQQREQGDQQVA